MKEKKENKISKIKKLTLFERLQNYAKNCRYSFNRMLST